MIRHPSNGDLGEATPGTPRLNSPRQRRTLKPHAAHSGEGCPSPLVQSTSEPTSPQGHEGLKTIAKVAAAAALPSHAEMESPSTFLNMDGLTLNSPCLDSTGTNSVCTSRENTPQALLQQPMAYFTPQPASTQGPQTDATGTPPVVGDGNYLSTSLFTAQPNEMLGTGGHGTVLRKQQGRRNGTSLLSTQPTPQMRPTVPDVVDSFKNMRRRSTKTKGKSTRNSSRAATASVAPPPPPPPPAAGANDVAGATAVGAEAVTVVENQLDELWVEEAKTEAATGAAVPNDLKCKSGRVTKESLSRLGDNLFVKGLWTREEDETLKKAVEKYGMHDWVSVEREMTGRRGKQCRERYFNHLEPGIVKTPWTAEEDTAIVNAVHQYGSKWTFISKVLPQKRSPNGIKNRWNATLRRRVAAGLTPVPPPAPVPPSPCVPPAHQLQQDAVHTVPLTNGFSFYLQPTTGLRSGAQPQYVVLCSGEGDAAAGVPFDAGQAHVVYSYTAGGQVWPCALVQSHKDDNDAGEVGLNAGSEQQGVLPFVMASAASFEAPLFPPAAAACARPEGADHTDAVMPLYVPVAMPAPEPVPTDMGNLPEMVIGQKVDDAPAHVDLPQMCNEASANRTQHTEAPAQEDATEGVASDDASSSESHSQGGEK